MSGSLLCQEDAYKRKVTANVLRCEAAADGFEVVLDATIMYPESGGQPADHGSIDGQPVRFVRRLDGDGGAVAHQVDHPLDLGAEVEVAVDWARRYDHMQQHTAQHLITALAQDGWGHRTIAFHLSSHRCDIELDCQALPTEQLKELEARANQQIRQARPITHRWVEPAELRRLQVRTRGLPQGHQGQVRLVEIEGLDLNTCGGTHVASSAELQAIKLVGTERLSRGIRLYYLAGQRVTDRLGQVLDREQALVNTLTCAVDDLPDAVDRMRGEVRELRRQARGARDELAQSLGALLLASRGVATLHRPTPEMDLMRGLAAAFHKACPQRWALITGGDEQGTFVMAGPDDALRAVAPRAAAAIQGKGGGARGLYQGKAEDLAGRQAALEILTAASEESGA